MHVGVCVCVCVCVCACGLSRLRPHPWLKHFIPRGRGTGLAGEPCFTQSVLIEMSITATSKQLDIVGYTN